MLEGTFAVPAGTIQTPSDDLIPFRKEKSNPGHDKFWTSEDVRDWNKFGYNYLGKRIIRGASGQNELSTFPIDLDVTDRRDLNIYFGQFYAWTANSAPTPSLLTQFYPIDVSNIEALTGKLADERPTYPRAHPSRTPNDPIPDATKPDYSYLDGHIKYGKLRQWNANVRVQK